MLILKVDGNGMLRDDVGRTRNNAGQLINAQGAVIPDVIAVAEMNDFDLSREWYDGVGQDPSRVFLTKIPENTSKNWRISCQGVSRMKCLNTICSEKSSLILSLEMHSNGSVNCNQDL